MKLEELGLTAAQIKALEKKKVVSVEALLRRPPLRYFNFSKTYPLSVNDAKTAEFMQANRPFAIIGKCISYSVAVQNHARMIKLRIEDEATKNMVGASGNTLFCNIMGMDVFRQNFLDGHPENPVYMDIIVPENLRFYQGESFQMKPSCKKQIDFVNSLDELAVKDFIALKTGGSDGWSCRYVGDFGDDAVAFVRSYTSDNGSVINILRWWGRGLRLDLAIKKVLLDDNGLLKRLLLDKRLLVGGFIEYKEDMGIYSVMNPQVVSDRLDDFDGYVLQYGQVKGITPERYKDIIRRSYDGISSLDFIPTSVCEQFDIPSFKDSAYMMHFPKSYWHIKKANLRATVEDLLYLAVKMQLQSSPSDHVHGVVMNDFSLMRSYTDSLPYELTGDQKKCINQLFMKMKNGSCVNSLVQGDVGTGKTAVAFCLMLIAASNGYQSALAAPYTTLAAQHYRDMSEIAERLGIQVAFLTSDVKGKKKKNELERIRSGEAKIIIGTHSIFSKDVVYDNLALIIQDEEHKFGVVHRDNFREKAIPGFHQVTMSATPIPKSIAATIYGDEMNVISIIDKPANRIPVQTAVCKNDVTALQFMEKQIREGHQCYVVCPSIDKNEKNESLASIEEKEKIYRRYLEDRGFSLAVVTGKLKAAEKQQIMSDYTAGKIDVLMATTVIEVGINVPNATVIVITGAERFGFSTLHQLRGRVGRGAYKSYCILQTDESNEKLDFLCGTTDGFEIAQKDLELRGPGSLFGEKQSGDNYYISLMLANEELYQKIKPVAKSLCSNNTGKDIVRRYEEIFRAEEER